MSVDQLPYARFADMYVGATNADGVTITPQHRTKNKLNYAFTVSATWSFYKGMGLTADFTQMERSPRMTDYANMGPQTCVSAFHCSVAAYTIAISGLMLHQ